MRHVDVMATAGNWHKSTFSQAQNGCVEVGSAPGLVGVRDTKLGTDSPVLVFTTGEWATFLTAVKNGQL